MALDLLFPNFDELIRKPEDVQRLNEAILQLAVQGKLVAQDPNDEPASELLKRIEAEKTAVGARKASRKSKPCRQSSNPFPIANRMVHGPDLATLAVSSVPEVHAWRKWQCMRRRRHIIRFQNVRDDRHRPC